METKTIINSNANTRILEIRETSCIPEEWEFCQKGDIVRFGSYTEYDDPLEEYQIPMEWKILDIVDNKALIIPNELYFRLDYKDGKYKSSDWAESTSRTNCKVLYGDNNADHAIASLNCNIQESLFSDEEKACILKTTLPNKDINGNPLPDTEDYLFNLSLDEYLKYFGNGNVEKIDRPQGKAENGETLPELFDYSVPEGICYVHHFDVFALLSHWYPLRDLSANGSNYMVSGDMGAVCNLGHEPTYELPCYLRPAMWVDIEACKNIKTNKDEEAC